MQGDLLTQLLLPAGLMFIMFSLGVSLAVEDFRRVFRYPRAFGVGLLCHFILLPVVGFLVVTAWGVTGAMAVGFMLIAACPTGTTSNLLTYFGRGDVALAVSFTAVAGILSIVTVPFILAASLEHFLGAARRVDFPVVQVMGQILLVMGIPVAAGMALRARSPAFAKRWQQRLGTFSALVFVAIVVASVAKSWALFAEHTGRLAPLVFSINVAMMALGFFLSRLARVDLRQSATVAIESSVQNAALAIVIGGSILKDDVMVLPGAIYGVLMYFTGIAFVFLMRRFLPPPGAAETAAARAALH